MRQGILSACCLCILLSSPWVSAQEAVQQPLQIGPSGEAYLAATRFRGVESDVAYYDPTGAVPPLETGQEPPPAAPTAPKTPGTDLSTTRIIAILLSAAILIGLAMLILRSSGNFTLSLQGEAQNPARSRRSSGKGGGLAPPDRLADLDAILRMSDRRLALVMLAQAALARTVAANGVLLQPSWTMRDALRHIPKGQMHVDRLRGLVMDGERVLFGNRTVSEAEFQAHIAAIRPLMTGSPA